MNKGVFITLEGPDACGKTTQAKYLVQLLTERGYKVTLGREPGGVPVAEKLRSMILHENLHPLSELFLFFAGRAENIAKLIRPALDRGEVVIFDRFIDSSEVFQGHGRGLLNQVEILKKMLYEAGLQRIDHTLFFDISLEESLKRLAHRSGEDRFELETLDFKRRIFAGYQECFELYSHRMRRIDAGGTIAEVNALIEQWVEWFVEQHPLEQEKS